MTRTKARRLAMVGTAGNIQPRGIKMVQELERHRCAGRAADWALRIFGTEGVWYAEDLRSAIVGEP